LRWQAGGALPVAAARGDTSMQNDMPARRPGELIFTIILLVFSLFMLWQAYAISGFSSVSSAGAFPMAMAAIMATTSVISIVANLKRRADPDAFKRFRKDILPPAVIVFAALILVYSLLLEPLGFILASFAFLLTASSFLQGGNLKRALLLSTLSIVGVYIVFRLIFQVVLPEGIIPERAIMAAVGDFFSGAR
jgi:putative tricarboxylic transport membrane protein